MVARIRTLYYCFQLAQGGWMKTEWIFLKEAFELSGRQLHISKARLAG